MIFDKDRNGTIDGTEIKHALHVLGNCPTDVELETIMASLDENGNMLCSYLKSKKLNRLIHVR